MSNGVNDIESSFIQSASYDQAAQALTVQFKSGATWRYDGVPPEEAEAFGAATSKGRHFGIYIRNQYKGTKTASAEVDVVDVLANTRVFPDMVLGDVTPVETVAQPAPCSLHDHRFPKEEDDINLSLWCATFRDIFNKEMDISAEGRMNMAIAQLRAYREYVLGKQE